MKEVEYPEEPQARSLYKNKIAKYRTSIFDRKEKRPCEPLFLFLLILLLYPISILCIKVKHNGSIHKYTQLVTTSITKHEGHQDIFMHFSLSLTIRERETSGRAWPRVPRAWCSTCFSLSSTLPRGYARWLQRICMLQHALGYTMAQAGYSLLLGCIVHRYVCLIGRCVLQGQLPKVGNHLTLNPLFAVKAGAMKSAAMFSKPSPRGGSQRAQIRMSHRAVRASRAAAQSWQPP